MRFDFVIIALLYISFCCCDFALFTFCVIHTCSEWVRLNERLFYDSKCVYIYFTDTTSLTAAKIELSSLHVIFSSILHTLHAVFVILLHLIFFFSLNVLISNLFLFLIALIFCFVLFLFCSSFFFCAPTFFLSSSQLLIAHFEITEQRRVKKKKKKHENSNGKKGKSVWGRETNSFLNNKKKRLLISLY